jgi:hypothetical protein
MDKITRTVTLLATVALSLALTALPALATEGAEKIQLPSTPRDRAGIFVLGGLAIFAIAGLINARKQLRGERRQADGQFRWR